jgi:hypothetical protein
MESWQNFLPILGDRVGRFHTLMYRNHDGS